VLEKKELIITLSVLLHVFFFFPPEIISFAQDSEAPSATLPTEQGTIARDSEVIPYTTEEFSQLPDDQKRDIYFNSPQLLPKNFDPGAFRDILHLEVKEKER
jgi:hypothetical protein